MATVFEISDITAVLRAAGIDYRIEHPGTVNASVHVRRADGRTVAFGPSTTETGGEADGIDVAYYRDGVDSDVVTQDWVATADQLVSDLRAFIA